MKNRLVVVSASLWYVPLLMTNLTVCLERNVQYATLCHSDIPVFAASVF